MHDPNYFLFQAYSRSEQGFDEDDLPLDDSNDSTRNSEESSHMTSKDSDESENQRVPDMEERKQSILAELIEAVGCASPEARESGSPQSLPPSPPTSWLSGEPETISQTSRSLNSSPIVSRRRPPRPPRKRRSPERIAGIQRMLRPRYSHKSDGPIAQMFRRLQEQPYQEVPSAPVLQQVPLVPDDESKMFEEDGHSFLLHDNGVPNVLGKWFHPLESDTDEKLQK